MSGVPQTTPDQESGSRGSRRESEHFAAPEIFCNVTFSGKTIQSLWNATRKLCSTTTIFPPIRWSMVSLLAGCTVWLAHSRMPIWDRNKTCVWLPWDEVDSSDCKLTRFALFWRTFLALTSTGTCLIRGGAAQPHLSCFIDNFLCCIRVRPLRSTGSCSLAYRSNSNIFLHCFFINNSIVLTDVLERNKAPPHKGASIWAVYKQTSCVVDRWGVQEAAHPHKGADQFQSALLIDNVRCLQIC